jgi:hypothetical protein
MKTHLRILRALSLALAIPATGAPAQAPASQASPILAPIDAMFHGMTQRDAAAIKAAAIP